MTDALSRKAYHSAQCDAISIVIPQWITEVVVGYSQDNSSLSIVAKHSINAKSVPNFTLSQGILRYKNRIWVGDNAAPN